MVDVNPMQEWRLPRVAMLSQTDILKIHEVSLRILDQVGVVVHHDRARLLLENAGARIDQGRRLAKFPAVLVERALQQAPRAFSHTSLRGDRDVQYSVDGGPVTRPITGVNRIIDAGSSTPRAVGIEDVTRWARLANALRNIHVVAGVHAQDVPQSSCGVHTLAAMLKHSDKPIMMSGYTGAEVRWWQELVRAASGQDCSRLMCLSSVNSPLNYDQHQCDLALACAERGVLLVLSSPGLAGAQSPVTLAGSLAQMNAEILAAITIVQTAFPGSPVVYGAYPGLFNLQKASISFGAAEEGLLVTALVQMGRFYRLPAASIGPVTDSIVCDQQAGIEKTLSVYLSMLSGACIVGCAGALDHAGLGSLEQMAIDDDVFGYIERQMRGIAINPETLAFDAIRRVGPEGNFLEDAHTIAHMRSEYYVSPIANRQDAWAWQTAGGKDLWARAAERVRAILCVQTEPVVGPESLRDMDQVVRSADQALNA